MHLVASIKRLSTFQNLQRVCFIFLFIFYLEQLIHFEVYTELIPKSGIINWTLIGNVALLFGLFLNVVTPRRWISFTCLIIVSANWGRFSEIFYGADQMSFNLLLFNCFFSQRTQEKRDLIHLGGIILLLSHLIVIYMMNGWSKINDPIWLDGALIANHVFPAMGFLGAWMTKTFPWLAQIVGLTVILLQFSIMGILFRRTRKPIAFAFIFFHASVAFTLHALFGISCLLIHCLVFSYDGNFLAELKDFSRWDADRYS